MLRLLLVLSIVLLPNAQHLWFDTGIPGMNFSNLLLLMLLAALALSPRDPAASSIRIGQLTVPMILLFLTLAMGFIVAQWNDLSRVMEDLTRLKNAIFYPLFYFIYRRCRQDLQSTRRLIILVLLVAAVAGIEAIYQGLQFGVGEYVENQRASGPFGGVSMANRAGVFYAMFLPMFAALAVLHQRKSVRLWALGGCVLLAVAILFTYSRQSYLIALVGLLILLMHRSVIAAVLAGLLLLFSVNLFPDSVIQRVQETRQVDAGGDAGVDQSTASRFEIWEGALDMWRDHPGGVGLGRFTTHIGDYSSYSGVDAHNAFVLTLAECGPLGLIVLLWLFWRMWRLSGLLRRSAASNDPEARALALGFKITMISVAISNMYGSPFFEGLIMANVWILCGLLERYATLKAHAAGALVPVGQRLPIPSLRFADRFPMVARATPGVRTTPKTLPR